MGSIKGSIELANIQYPDKCRTLSQQTYKKGEDDDQIDQNFSNMQKNRLSGTALDADFKNMKSLKKKDAIGKLDNISDEASSLSYIGREQDKKEFVKKKPEPRQPPEEQKVAR